jgi:exo-beta-1,3-glucanase (GH17 family)
MSKLRATLAVLLPAAALAALLAWAWNRGQPVALPEVAGARVPCVSYAPFHRPGQTPFDPTLVIPREQIVADLTQLRDFTGCVRTYGLDHGLHQVPGVARELGLRVLLGLWIGRDAAANEAQLRRGLALAREYRDTIDLLIVGNEVLLRREQSPEQMAAILARARRESPVPIAYADVWEFWLRHRAALQPQVDVVAAHILPYWEDEPVGIGAAVDHVYSIARQLRSVFGDTPVYVGETGWPAAGRQRGPAQPGELEQARFVRELLARHAAEPLDFNLIEAYDQPWKRALEGAMGGHWGVFDADGGARVHLTGPVAADPHWMRIPLAAALGALLGAALAFAPAARGRRAAALAALVIAGGLIGALALLKGEALLLWSRNGWELALGVVTAAVATACGVAAAWRLAVGNACSATRPSAVDAWRQPTPYGQPPTADNIDDHGDPTTEARRSRASGNPVAFTSAAGFPLARERQDLPQVLGAEARPRASEVFLASTQLAWLFIAAMLALGLVFDARYRPLDWPLLAGPAVLLLALALRGERLAAGAREERVLALVCVVCAPLIVLNEGLANTEALLTAAALAALAVATLPRQAEASARRTSTSAPSSAAGAPSAAE